MRNATIQKGRQNLEAIREIYRLRSRLSIMPRSSSRLESPVSRLYVEVTGTRPRIQSGRKNRIKRKSLGRLFSKPTITFESVADFVRTLARSQATFAK